MHIAQPTLAALPALYMGLGLPVRSKRSDEQTALAGEFILTPEVAPLRNSPALSTQSCDTECRVNKDQVKGQIKKVKGNIKENAGKVLGDKKMESKGAVQNAAGKIQKAYGDVKEDIKNGS